MRPYNYSKSKQCNLAVFIIKYLKIQKEKPKQFEYLYEIYKNYLIIVLNKKKKRKKIELNFA